MNVIGHDNVPTDGDSALLSQLSKADELRMHSRVRQQSISMMSIERNEKEGRIILWEDMFQPRRRIGHLQASRCRGACAKRLFIDSAFDTKRRYNALRQVEPSVTFPHG
jgi:hypothetical protein